MEALFNQWIVELSAYAPLIIFGTYILTGFLFPLPEELIFLTVAMLLRQDQQSWLWIGIATYGGALTADFMLYAWGRLSQKGLQQIQSPVTMQIQNWLYSLDQRVGNRGFLTIFVGRFIPLGVRGLIFFSAGATAIPVRTVLTADVAALCIIPTLYIAIFLVLGEAVESHLFLFQIGIASIAVVLAGAFLLTRRNRRS